MKRVPFPHASSPVFICSKMDDDDDDDEKSRSALQARALQHHVLFILLCLFNNVIKRLIDGLLRCQYCGIDYMVKTSRGIFTTFFLKMVA